MQKIYVMDCTDMIFDALILQARGSHFFHGEIEMEIGDLFINVEYRKDKIYTGRIAIEEIIDIFPKSQITVVATIVKNTS